jgi:hypothetical protein
MTYAAVATAKADTATVGQAKLALEKKAAVQIVNLVSSGDQRERALCQRVLSDAGVPVPISDLVLLMLDINGNLATHTDAQVDTAVNDVWPRMIALVA